jgi:hypothetical protein
MLVAIPWGTVREVLRFLHDTSAAFYLLALRAESFGAATAEARRNEDGARAIKRLVEDVDDDVRRAWAFHCDAPTYSHYVSPLLKPSSELEQALEKAAEALAEVKELAKKESNKAFRRDLGLQEHPVNKTVAAPAAGDPA